MPHPSPPVPPLLGRIIEPLYALGIASRNRRFDRGDGVARLPIPIISVGNLSVGGTGKTPMVALLIAELRAAGRHPAIAMRGYQPRRARRSAAAPEHNFSDEAALYRAAFPDLAIVAQPDRTAGLRALLASPDAPPIDCVVLDDGFQHRQLARDLDIVLIDASRSPFEDRLLPRGWLREPPSSLRRAHAVVITHAPPSPPPSPSEALTRLEHQITLAHGKPPLAVTRHTWSHLALFDPAAASDAHLPPSTLRGRRTLAVCAIGNPDPFFAAAAHHAGSPDLCTTLPLPDHDPYHPATVQRIIQQAKSTAADLILTTEKDWTKLSHLPATTWPVPVARPHLQLTFTRGREALIHLAVITVSRAPTPPGPP